MKFLGLAGSALALVFVSATAAAAYPATSTVSANVRSGPGAQYKVVDHLATDTSVDVGACRSGWCQVGPGWVKQSLLATAAPTYPANSYYAYNEPYYYDDYYDDDYPFDDDPFFFGFHHRGFHGHHGDHGHGHGFPGHDHGMGSGHAFGGSRPVVIGRASTFGPAPGMGGHFEGGGFGHGGGFGGGFGGHGGGGGFGGGGFGGHGGGGGGHR